MINLQNIKQTHMPLVQIVMPVYNRELTVRKSVESIISQTFQNWSLIIVDDNSTDNSSIVIQELIDSDSRITSKINTEYSHSCAGARLSGLEGAKADYFAFLDSDDEWPDYHLEEFIDYLEKNSNIDCVFGDLQRIDVNGKVLVNSKFSDEAGLPKRLEIEWKADVGVFTGKHNLAIALEERFNTGMHTAMYKGDFFESVQLRDVYGCEDALLTMEALSKNKNYSVMNKTHLKYLIHEDNISSVGGDLSFEHAEKNSLSEIQFYSTYIPKYVKLSPNENKSRVTKLANIHVFELGNNVYRKHGFKRKALSAIFKGITLNPSNLKFYKSFISTLLGIKF
jgi:glycosyltransferase involved in cell wall biosynthesis